MLSFEPSAVIGPFIAVQLFGFMTAWLARFSLGTARQTWSQWLFLLTLALVGLTTMAAFKVGPGYWLFSGVTLSTMILVVICDFKHGQRVTAF